MFCKVFLTLMRQIGLMPLIFKKKRIGIMRRLALALSQSVATERIMATNWNKLFLFSLVN